MDASPIQVVLCETQTHTPELLSQLVQTSASEQASIQLADDVWAGTQKKIDEIGTLIFSLRSRNYGFIDLLSFGHCGREGHAEEVGELQSFDEQTVHEQVRMQFTEPLTQDSILQNSVCVIGGDLVTRH